MTCDQCERCKYASPLMADYDESTPCPCFDDTPATMEELRAARQIVRRLEARADEGYNAPAEVMRALLYLSREAYRAYCSVVVARNNALIRRATGATE